MPIAKVAKNIWHADAVHGSAHGGRARLRVRSFGAHRVPRRRRAAISTGPRCSSVPKAAQTRRARWRSRRRPAAHHRRWRVATTLPRADAPRARLRPLPRRELRRADRPSGRDRRFRLRATSMPAASRTRSRSPAATTPTCRASRAISRASANGRSTSSATPRSTATCSRSRRSATATAVSSIARARAFCAAATSCRSRQRRDRRRLPHASSASRATSTSTLERQAHQAGRLRALRSHARSLHAPALGVRRAHVVLRRSRARAQRGHRRRSAISSSSAAR